MPDERECVSLEERVLQEAMEKGRPVRLIFTNGFQTMGTIVDFHYGMILVKVKGKRWLVSWNALSTIVLD